MLLAIGMLLQIITYFDFDFRTKNFPVTVNFILNYLEWGLMALIAAELFSSCWKVMAIRRKSA
jgi:hypothetical protein